MKSFQVALCIFFLAIVFWSSCDPIEGGGTDDPPGSDRDTIELKGAIVAPNEVDGGNYPPVVRDPTIRLNELDTPYIVPIGPIRTDVQLSPEHELKELPEQDSNSQAPLSYYDYEEIDDATPSAHQFVPEPSVAENGDIVMHTGNFWVAVSDDGGRTFTTRNPTTIFPEDYGGFCCDQVLQYVPQYDLWVWLLQYQTDASGVNAIRIAVQDSDGVIRSNGTAWTYWDFRSTVYSTSSWLDYNDMSFGNDFLYWTTSVVGGTTNRFVTRVPLRELAARSTVNFQYTGATKAFWSHLTQGGSNGVYWAGHENNSTMRVYSMLDADGFYSWRDVPINSWPNSTSTSTAANGTDWLFDARNKTYVRAAAKFGNSLYFAWNASAGDGFPNPHIQIAELDASTYSLKNQMQVWNQNFAFAYPYFHTNAEGELGMIVAFGGGPYNSSSGVGVWGDFVIYYPRLSSASRNNYGHYHTARRSGSENMQWVGSGYIIENDNSITPYYVRFGR